MKEKAIENNSDPLILKTQISHLRSGTKRQMLNNHVCYKSLPRSTSHAGHAGTNHSQVNDIWSKVVSENPRYMIIVITNRVFTLFPKWSVSGKSVEYVCFISSSLLEYVFSIRAAKYDQAYISISGATEILVSNGKKSFIHICPSLITIL